MDVKDIMTKKVITVDANSTVRNACKLMDKHDVGCLLVTEEGSSAVGIVTERDVIRKVVKNGKDPEIITIKRIMTTPLVVISPEASVETAVDTMIKNRIKKIPVVSDENDLVGIVTATDIVTNCPSYLKKVASLMVREVKGIGG
jgi:CBS domain-containing protein